MSERICPHCKRAAEVTQAAFCPFCGSPLEVITSRELPREAAELLRRADQQENVKKKLKLLRQAQQEYPGWLEIEEEILFQGKLPEKPPITLDFSCIKSHLLHMYLTPEEFTAETMADMRQELFHHPQLMVCLELAESKDAYMRHYLKRLSREFIQIFLFGSSQYMPTLLGIRLEHKPERALAEPAAKVLRGIRSDSELTAEELEMLYRAFEEAFSQEVGGNLQYLRKCMEG